MIAWKLVIILNLLIIIGCDDVNINQPKNDQDLLVENCEDGDNTILIGGKWYVATDSIRGGKSLVGVLKDSTGEIRCTGEGFQSNFSFQMGYHLDKSTYSYNPFVICGITLSIDSGTFDASGFKVISYAYKGPAHSLRVETTEIIDFCYHSFKLPASDVWKIVTIPFEDLSQDFWGEQKIFDCTSLKGLSWQISGNSGDSASILIDNISFGKTIDCNEIPSKKEITLNGTGIQMKASLFQPQKDGKYPIAIVLPGGTSTSDIGKAFSHHYSIGEIFSSKEIAMMVLDYSSSVRSFFDTMQIEDIGKAVEFSKSLPFVDKNKIFLIGFSIGGANGLRVAGSRDDIAGLVSYFAPSDWSVNGGGYGIKKQPISYCSNISCPVLILQGDSDQITDVSQSILLRDTLQSLNKSVKLVIYNNAAHGFTYKGVSSGRCVYNQEVAEKSFLEVESFIRNLLKF